jgi:hypothetical protein
MNDYDQDVLDEALYGGGPPVHLAGPLRPFARCGSYRADERHSADPGDVTCLSCIQTMSEAELEQGQ